MLTQRNGVEAALLGQLRHLNDPHEAFIDTGGGGARCIKRDFAE